MLLKSFLLDVKPLQSYDKVKALHKWNNIFTTALCSQCFEHFSLVDHPRINIKILGLICSGSLLLL